MNNVFTWHSLVILNIALAFSFILTKFILNLSLIKFYFTQKQQLIFSRYSLIIMLAIFISMPMFLSFYLISSPTIELSPYLKHASQVILAPTFQQQATLLDSKSESSQIPYKTILIIGYLMGLFSTMYLYIKAIFSLNKLSSTGCQHHQLNRVKILISDDHHVPFCWSTIFAHYICLPSKLFATPNRMNSNDILLAVRHELQHIRHRDTIWLHLIWWLRIIFFCNPFLFAWKKLFHELQEFACDEALIINRRTSQTNYAQCLVNSARQALNNSADNNAILAIDGLSKSLLYKRIEKLFSYKKIPTEISRNIKRKIIILSVYLINFIAMISVAFASNGKKYYRPITTKQLTHIIERSNLDPSFNIIATPEVVTELNRILQNKKLNYETQLALQRMKNYAPYILKELNAQSMPRDLLVLPLIESRYKPLDQSLNRVRAAGIWQIIPSTATSLGLTIDRGDDQRLNTELSTKAALKLLNNDFKIFSNWKLTVLAYEYGEDTIDNLIKKTRFSDPWKLVRAPAAPKEAKQFLANFYANIIIMHNPTLLPKNY